jgi:hypothetical protein
MPRVACCSGGLAGWGDQSGVLSRSNATAGPGKLSRRSFTAWQNAGGGGAGDDACNRQGNSLDIDTTPCIPVHLVPLPLHRFAKRFSSRRHHEGRLRWCKCFFSATTVSFTDCRIQVWRQEPRPIRELSEASDMSFINRFGQNSAREVVSPITASRTPSQHGWVGEPHSTSSPANDGHR